MLQLLERRIKIIALHCPYAFGGGRCLFLSQHFLDIGIVLFTGGQKHPAEAGLFLGWHEMIENICRHLLFNIFLLLSRALQTVSGF